MKFGILLITAIVLAGCATSTNVEDPISINEEASENEFPSTIDAAADRAIEESPATFHDVMLSTPQQSTIKFHRSFGRFIRNSYGLWGDKNPALLADCGNVHPDNCSTQIIERVWQKLRSQQPPHELLKIDTINEVKSEIEIPPFSEEDSGILRYVEFLNSQIAQSEYSGQFEVHALCESRHYRFKDFQKGEPTTLSRALGYIEGQFVADIVIKSDRIELRPLPFLDSPHCDELN